ncbi:MAG: hypothetical protein BZ151_04065 [Desulfobacca sp. 4484_104]|nr:MAG: hypothetical protein BZ151_04065 [Desulfobacca sp. 4484_104]RLA89705.1 MAG: hypothetical protein DRG58_04390 [Deltaproteobacteria bacterium]
MEIIKVKHHSEDELIGRLRQVPLKEQPEVLVYRHALITLELIHTNYLHPPQNYLWLQELRKVQELRWSLRDNGLDMFRLDGFVTYTVRAPEGKLVSYDLYPPVIEESFEADGTVALIINDGMHRVYLARQEWVVPQVIYVRGVPKAFPYYAFPRPRGWEGLDLLAENPDRNRYLKKCHRIRYNKTLYRDFQAVFKNVGGSRSELSR